MNSRIDRRAFLRRSGIAGISVAAAGGLPAFLAGCGSSTKSSSATTTGSTGSTVAGSTAAAGSLGSIDYQLSWIKNAEFAGSYISDTKGYYTQQGFSKVSLVSGGPSVSQDAIIAAGKAFVGISSPDITAPAIEQGASIIAIGAQYQKNPFAIMSLASKPLMTPQDMIGKKIGVQATNQAVWTSFLKANNIDPSKINLVPSQFDPSPLAAGQVDGWFSFVTNEPLALAAKGVQTTTFLLNDFNYPLVSEIYVTQKSSLASTADRAKLKAFLVGEIMGWRDSLKDPSEGATLAATVYGKDQGLDATEQTSESKAQNLLILTDRTKTDGIFTITPEQISQNISTLGIGGSKVTAAQLFDLSLITELYQEHPDLKPSPV